MYIAAGNVWLGTWAVYRFLAWPTRRWQRTILPKKQVSTLFKDTKHLSADGKINSWWYVGYDKAKNYQLRPDWIKSWKDGEIPSVCRAQTFKCVNGGILEAISLSLQNNGVKSSNWGSPLYVQIWGTKTKQAAPGGVVARLVAVPAALGPVIPQ